MIDLTTLAKAEVHVHLEGCSTAAALADRAATAGVPLPRPVDSLFEVADFDDFLHFLSWSCGLFVTADDVAAAARSYAQRAAASGVVCADLIVNPTHWGAWYGNLGGFLDALDGGLTEAQQDGLPPVGLCISILRTQTSSEAAELVEELVALDHPRVVALSIDGNEALAGRTGPRFADVFATARAAGLRCTVHAGESSGPEGVRDALQLLGADRIDHGVRAVEDPALVAELAERATVLNICPTSNLTLGLYASIDEHPIEVLRSHGVRVTVNTDDPGFLGNDLVGEYQRCIDAFGWDEQTVADVAATSIDTCFAARWR